MSPNGRECTLFGKKAVLQVDEAGRYINRITLSKSLFMCVVLLASQSAAAYETNRVLLTSITTSNINTAADAWVSDSANATATYGDISGWDTSAVTSLYATFYASSAFNDDISAWDTGAVTTLHYTFARASAFNQDISRWNISMVTSMYATFEYTGAFNQDIGEWDTSSVTNLFYTFNGATAFNQNIRRWDVRQITSLFKTFTAAHAFNQDIGAWDTSAVTALLYTFSYASAFNQDIGSWDTSAVTSCYETFYSASAFNQILCWNTTKISTTSMFTGSSGSADPNSAKCACTAGEYYSNGTSCQSCSAGQVSSGKTESCYILPTPVPTPVPSLSWHPSTMPTSAPSLVPSLLPSLLPSPAPTLAPSLPPSELPMPVPTLVPSLPPFPLPTPAPTQLPSLSPSNLPAPAPTPVPSLPPSSLPTLAPTLVPSLPPSSLPTPAPTSVPSLSPSDLPTPASTLSFAPSLVPSVLFEANGDGTGSGMCYHHTSTVTRLAANGKSVAQVPLTELREGNSILAADHQGRPLFTKVEALLHGPSAEPFVRIVMTGEGQQGLKATLHHTFDTCISKRNPFMHAVESYGTAVAMAKDIKVGDCLHTAEGKRYVRSIMHTNVQEGDVTYSIKLADSISTVAIGGVFTHALGHNKEQNHSPSSRNKMKINKAARLPQPHHPK